MNDQDFISSLESDAPTSEPLAEARKIVSGLAVRVNSDKKAAFAPDVIDALRLLKESEGTRGDYVEALNIMKACGVAVSEVKSEVVKSAKLRAVQPGEKLRRLACDYLNNAPIADLVIPGAYKIASDNSGGYELIVSDGFMGAEVVAHCAPLITGRTVDIDEEHQGLRLSWSRGNGFHHRVVNRADLFDARKIVNLTEFGYAVTTSNAKLQVDYFAQLEADNLNLLPTAKTTSHLGWQGKGREAGFLIGRQFIKPDGELVKSELRADAMDWSDGVVVFRGHGAGDEQIAEGYYAQGNYGDWINAVQIASKFPRVLATIYCAFVPPMLAILDCPNFIFDLCSVTSEGKTTAQRAAASVWGCPDERQMSAALQTWDVTKVFVERASAVLCDMPLILDDTKRATDTRIISSVLYAVASGRGRGRGSVQGIQRSRVYRTVLISSGEQKVTSFSTDAGAKMRVLEIEGTPFGKVNAETAKIVEGLNIAFRSNFGHAGVRFVQWLNQNRDKWPEFRARFNEKAKAYIEAASSEKAGRMATYAAAIAVTAELVHEALQLPFAFDDPLAKLWAEISSEADDPVGAKRALRHIKDWSVQHAHQFDGRFETDRNGNEVFPLGGIVGKWDNGEDYESIAYLRNVLVKELEGQKFNPDAIFAEWMKRDWLDVTESDRNWKRNTKLVRVRENHLGKAHGVRMIVIKRSAFDDCEE